jgi:drug/metabolite transporter (DMT)-like permease
VIAVLGGLGAAVCWATGTLCAARASRLIGAPAVLAWVMLVGFVVAVPLALGGGIPAELRGGRVVWFVLAGVGNVAGLLLAYEAMRIGKVSVVTPITATEGAIAAVLAVATGEGLRASSAVVLALIAGGVVLASHAPARVLHEVGGQPVRSTLLAACAAGLFGLGLFATARVSAALPLAWALVPPRAVGVAAVTLPVLAARGLRIMRAAVPLVVAAGLCEVGGFASYAVGSRHAIPVSAVLASQFAALTTVAALVLFRERLTRSQLAGVLVVVAGVSALSALQA